MSITAGVPVPTSYRRLQEVKIFNIHVRLLVVWACFLFFYGFIVIVLNKLNINIVALYIGSLVVMIFAVMTIARDVKTLDRNTHHLFLLYRIVRKKNVTKKYVEPLDDLKKIIPIDTVSEDGLIRYTDGASGVIVLYNPPRVADEDVDKQSSKMENVINSLYGGFTFQFIANSVIDIKNPLLEATTTAMKKKDTPKKITNHLHSLYEESVELRDSIDWDFTLLVTLPVTKDVDEAQKIKHAFMSGLLKNISRAGMHSRMVEQRNEVIMILRRHLQ